MTRSKVSTERFTLVNPHDAYEFVAPDAEVADAVTLLLGGGWFSWRRGDESGVLAGALDEVEQGEHVAAFSEVVERRKVEVVAALRSLEINPEGRIATNGDVEEWHEARRTSLADVRENALATAASLEAGDG